MHIFIGPNNSGKTNILDAISQLYQANPGRLNYIQTQLRIVFSVFGSTRRTLEIVQRGQNVIANLNGKRFPINRVRSLMQKHIKRISAVYPVSASELQNVYKKFQHDYPHRYREFKKSIEKHFPKIKLSDDFFRRTVVHEGGVDRTFERLGDGFQQIFTILLYFFHPQYTILLLEEPEIHLHPALVKRLYSILEKENDGDQIFITTHSPLFITATNLHRVFRVTRDGISTRVHSPRISGHRINYSRLRQELNADNLEMFFSDSVLLVEGPSDHILMRGLIDRFYHGDKDIKVIQTYGKSNMDLYVELLRVFDVPYAVLLDHDGLYDTGIALVQKNLQGSAMESEDALIDQLKKDRIFILPFGSIERHYPRKYQRLRKHKPQNALFASQHITESEFYSPRLKHLREVIEALY
ncbi:MAG: AAA family ATPase [Candidatus Kerfeldbacteria bacterium]|nr:AAA family ATPase [Candidatus Kerfeldbacteria bacterium]